MDISDFSDQANRYMTKQSTEFERDFRSNIQRRHIKHDGKTIEKKSKKNELLLIPGVVAGIIFFF